ncbi:MBL fold metallo-hydrolase [Candidatus Poribacteria bacterium]|nr:MBL fold metallo-hydrolase [Candidatus Poribacteria bacterium]
MKITFLGGANEVGASCTLIEIEEKRILVDAGIRMNVDQEEKLPDLDKVGMPDAFLLTHAHTDHTGALPGLVSRLPVDVTGYCTPATKRITRVLLEDSKNRQEREKQEEKEHLFTPEEIDAALQYLEFMEPVRWREPIPICNDVTATWIPAGHILGAAMIFIEGKQESILMTGDISVTDQKTIPGMSMSDFDFPKPVDVMVMESTYGNRQHKDRAHEEKRLVSDVARVIEAGGKVLIPVFAIGRAQEVILILKDAMQRGTIPKFPVWVDGMVRNVNSIYSRFADELLLFLKDNAEPGEDIFYSDVIKPVQKSPDRKSVSSWEPCCIVASSGMLDNGSSRGYFERLDDNPANLIAITGYQAEGTLGRRLRDLTEAKESIEHELKLDDEKPVLVKCQVKSYSLSAHADREQLTVYAENVQPRKLFLVHGESDAREELAQSGCERCREVEVVLPVNGKTYTVEKHPGIAEGRSHDNSKVLAKLYDFVLRMGLKGSFSDQQLTEIYFSTAATTPTTVAFLQLCLWLDSQFFKRESDNRFSPRQPA